MLKENPCNDCRYDRSRSGFDCPLKSETCPWCIETLEEWGEWVERRWGNKKNYEHKVEVDDHVERKSM